MSPKVTPYHRQEVRTRVLSAAGTLFAKKGYYDTSMDEIVSQSGLSKGAIYGHFRSKEELFVALQDMKVEDTLRGLKSTFAPGDSARTKLEKAADLVFESMVGSSKKDCRISLEFEVAAPRIKSLQDRRDGRFNVVHDFVRDLIREGIDQGEFKRDADPDSVALILGAMADGLALAWATTSFDFDWGALKAATKKTIAEGLLAKG